MDKKKGIFQPAILCLFLLSILIGTIEFIIIGILPEISQGLSVSVTQAGNAISIFAFAYAIGTPILSAFSGKYNRFRFMMICMSVLFAAQIICAASHHYGIFLLSRILTALMSGVLLSVAMTVPADTVVSESVPSAVALIFTGFSVASVLGVPFATTLSQKIGWRTIFLLLAGLTALLMAVMFFVLPKTSANQNVSIFRQFSLFRNPKIVFGVLCVLFCSAATYTFYTYLTPILQDLLHISEAQTGIALFLFGIAALISNLLSGFLARRYNMNHLLWVYCIQSVLLGLFLPASRSTALGAIVLFALGVVMYLLNSPSQMHFLTVSEQENPGCVNLASSLCPVFFNLGIATGSLVGGTIVDFAGLSYVGLGGLVLSILALLSACCLKRQKTTAKNSL